MASLKLATASALELKVSQQKTLDHEAMENNLLEKQQYRLLHQNTNRHFLSFLIGRQSRTIPAVSVT